MRLPPCKLGIGNRGSGKTVGQEVDLFHLGLQGETAIALFDLPGDSAERLCGQYVAAGLEKRVIYEIVSDTSRALVWPFIRNSTKEGLAGELENELEDEAFMQVFYAKRGLKSGEKNPFIKKYLELATRIHRSQPTILPITRILDVFRPGTKGHDELFANCSDYSAVFDMREIEVLRRRSPVQYQIETGGAERMLRILNSPCLRIRHGEGADYEELLENKFIILWNLANVTKEVARTITILGCNRVVMAAKRYFERTGKPLNVVIVLEESGVLDLATPFILDAMRELRKAGVSVWLVAQTLRDFDEDTMETLLSLADSHYWYRINSGIDRAAKDCADPTFNPDAVHYTRERVVNEGFDTIRRTLRGSSEEKTPDGKKRKRNDSRESVSYLPRQNVAVDQYYKSSQLQQQEWAKKLATLQVGERIVRDMNGVRLEKVTPLGEPFPCGLTAIRTLKAIDRIRSKPPFQAVQYKPTLPEPTQNSAASLNG